MKIYEKAANEKEKTYIMILEELETMVFTKMVKLRKINEEWITVNIKLYTFEKEKYDSYIEGLKIIEE